VIGEGEARQGAELVCASGVLAVGSAAGLDDVVFVLENFSCVMVIADGEVGGWVVGNDVFVVYHTVRV
jgi:hypothetical protein